MTEEEVLKAIGRFNAHINNPLAVESDKAVWRKEVKELKEYLTTISK